MSGRTRSMPSMSSCGNMSPASTTTTLPSHSSAHMLMPTSPRPPSGRYRSRELWRGPRELTPQALSSWGFSQKSQLFRFLLRGSDHNRRRRWREHLVEVVLHLVEVVLEVCDQRAVVQSGGGVIQRHVRDVTAPDQAAVDARYRSLPRHEPFERVPAEDEHHLRLDELHLLLDVRRARFGLVGHRFAVHRRPALEDVRDVYVGSAQADSGEQRIQQLPRRADERLALTVLIESRRFAHDHHVAGARPDARHRLGPSGMQAAVLARPDRFVELGWLLNRAKRLSLLAGPPRCTP